MHSTLPHTHPDARFKEYLDHDTLRDRAHAWEAGVAELRKRLRRLGLDQLSPRLRQHLFEGHLKKRKRGTGTGLPPPRRRRLPGPRRRADDRGQLGDADEHVLPRLLVACRRAAGDPVRVLNRTFTEERKWRGRARGLLIEGYVECRQPNLRWTRVPGGCTTSSRPTRSTEAGVVPRRVSFSRGEGGHVSVTASPEFRPLEDFLESDIGDDLSELRLVAEHARDAGLEPWASAATAAT